MIKMPLMAKLHISKFERKGYNKVTTISLKNYSLFKNLLLNKVTRSNYKFAGILKRPNAEKTFFCRKWEIMKDRGMILTLYLKTCPDIGSPTQSLL